MRQAIVTKYLGPTNFRGARVKASAQAGNIVIPWDDALDMDENHAAAAHKFANGRDWLAYSTLVGGALPDGTGYCFVLVSTHKGGK
jgi:hypothetical protein